MVWSSETGVCAVFGRIPVSGSGPRANDDPRERGSVVWEFCLWVGLEVG